MPCFWAISVFAQSDFFRNFFKRGIANDDDQMKTRFSIKEPLIFFHTTSRYKRRWAKSNSVETFSPNEIFLI